MRSFSAVVIALIVFALPAFTGTSDRIPLTVHEWGTFTSIAGPDGAAVAWIPQTGPPDLPCFVERNRFSIKGRLSGTVRMETPVLYFYAPHETTIAVRVKFRQGLITEWFPRARVTPAGGSNVFASASTITWPAVTVSPGATKNFPHEDAPSHYYAARDTDAAALVSGSDAEKFLFYRGVGRFLPPIAATVDDSGTVTVISPPDQPIGDVIVFTNDRGRMDRDPAADLERLLLAHGLYPAEARAMLETWRDSWFEEGTRVFYILPAHEIERILPLQITPAPTAIERVFVGRMELVTPRTLKEVKAALLANDAAALTKHGRFLEAIGARIIAESSRDEGAILQRRLQRASAAVTSNGRCADLSEGHGGTGF